MEELGLLLSEKPCVNYRAFIELVRFAVQNMWKDKVVFAAAYPDHDVDVTPIITHQIDSKAPGSVGSHREIKPRLRYSGKTEDGKIYNVWGQWFEYEVRFDIWGSTGEEADIFTEEFEDLMFQYIGYFKKKGVSEILFKRQWNDQLTKVWRADLTNRTLIYYVKLDETKVNIVGDIKSIDVVSYARPYLLEDPVDSVSITIDSNDT